MRSNIVGYCEQCFYSSEILVYNISTLNIVIYNELKLWKTLFFNVFFSYHLLVGLELPIKEVVGECTF